MATATRTDGGALGLTDRARFILEHCGEPMSWQGGQTHWTGKPGQGHEHHRAQYVCPICGAELLLSLTEPA